MDRYTITAYIRCYQDPQLVLACAGCLLWADQIVIADNSSDESVKNVIDLIAHFNVKYIHTDIVDWRLRLNGLKDQISSDFILMVDTDEYYSEQASKEILQVLSNRHSIKEGYIVPSESYIFCEYLGKGGDQLRLFMRDKFYIEFKSVHEMPKVNGQVGKLTNGYKHYNTPNFYAAPIKTFNYAVNDAKILTDEQLQLNRLDMYSPYKIKRHFFYNILRIVWRSRKMFFSRNIHFGHLWQQYLNILAIIANDTMPTDEIRIREKRNAEFYENLKPKQNL